MSSPLSLLMCALNALLPWHREQWRQLAAYMQQQRLPQALLIAGSEGLGALQLANYFAQALLCSARQADGAFCGQCQRCHFVAAGTHPDLLCLAPDEEGKAISVDQIRGLIAKLLLKPQFEAQRVAIIQPAEHMNRAAANAFLKCLEEPPERTLIILVSGQPFLLPATIRSRCQQITLRKPESQAAAMWLRQQQVQQDIDILLQLAHGEPLLAKVYAERDVLRQRGECFAAWEAVAKQRLEASSVAESWLSLNPAEVLAWLISWLQDLIKYRQHGAGIAIDNLDFTSILQKLAQTLDLQQLFGMYDLLLRCKRQMLTTVNKQLMFEEILIHWAQLNKAI